MSLLDHAIQQGGPAEGALRPIGFRDEHRMHWRSVAGRGWLDAGRGARKLGAMIFRAWLVSLCCVLPSVSAAVRPNVLFMAIDDLNDWVGCLHGHPQVQTPNLDALAARGTLFTNAHCQAPLCNPSRSSVLTGLRPSSTGIYGLAPGIRHCPQTQDRQTLPQAFRKAGWETFTCGKIYHDGSLTAAEKAAEFARWGTAGPPVRPAQRLNHLPEVIPLMDWGVTSGPEEAAGDYQIATDASAALAAAPADRPFFIACGFRLPHVPIYAPQKWFDLYPAATLQLPEVLAGDRADTPPFSWYLHWKLPEPRLPALQRAHEWEPLVRAYLAGTSFMDAQVGRVLAALAATGRAQDTVVVLWSDHGWHLGEKGITGKNTLWERSTHVPLILAGPGIVAGGRCAQPVELLDIYPTLLDLAAVPGPKDLEGLSLRPWLVNAAAPRERPAITTANQGNHSVRTADWRYIHYADGSEELYDEHADPHEWKNLAKTEPARCAELAHWLPKVDLPLTPGSKERTLTYDAATHQATWEGQVIVPAEAEDPDLTEAAEPPALTEYQGRKIAQTMHWQGAPWLQRRTREEEEHGGLMREQLEIRPGQTVCDLGSGDGYHTFWMAETVGPQGKVYAVDIQPEMLDLLQKRAAGRDLKNIISTLGKAWTPMLPPNSQDLILMVDVYHEFSHPEQMLRAMRLALKPTGRLVFVEFRGEDPQVPIKPEHKMSKAQVMKEVPPLGYKLVKSFDGLPWQHMLFFAREN